MQTHSETIVTVCEHCGSEFEGIRIFGFPQRCCDPCSERITAGKPPQQREDDRKRAFRSTLPPLFHDTDPKRLPRRITDAVNSYQYGAMGLAFIGEAGAGKSRGMYLLLERLATAGHRVEFITATDITRYSAEKFSNDSGIEAAANAKLRSIRRADALLIDDMGKGRVTPTAEETLYDVLNHRTESMLPTFWTSNAGSNQLHAMFSADRADALLRRLKDFTDIIRCG
jgi:DNA replication protein DnaC